MEKFFEAIKDHPYIAAGAAIVGVFVLMRSMAPAPRVQPGQPDYSATLQSLDITSRTNVALADIGVKRDQVIADSNAHAADALTAISLGAQDYYKADRLASMQERINYISSNNALASRVMDSATTSFQSVLGQAVAMKQLDNDAYSLATNRGATYQSLGNNLQLGLTDANNAFELAKTGMAYQRANQIDENQLSRDLTSLANLANYSMAQLTLPYDERMFNRQKASEENLYWRQYQIAKKQAGSSILNNLIGGIAQVATAGVNKI